jgi:peptide/nickel transport system substrate-binding protein
MAKNRARSLAWAATFVTATIAVTVGAAGGRRLPSNDIRPAAAGRAPARDANAALTSDVAVRPKAKDAALTNAAIGLNGDLFWMNLTSAKARDQRSRWLQHPDFRRAVAHAIDRQAFVDSVYRGAAVPADGIVSPGNRDWHVAAEAPAYDLDRAKSLLTSLGLSAKDGAGVRQDRNGRPARFMLLTQKGDATLGRGAAMIRDGLARVGVRVDVVSLEAGAVANYIQRGEYDAAYLRVPAKDTDPALNLDFWLSSGSAHVWNVKQKVPATAWESEIDSLMQQVAATHDSGRRRQLFADVQRIMARELPILCFAFPR